MSRLDIADMPSPNADARAEGRPLDILLLHYTGMRSGALARDWLTSPESRVSSHYVVEEDGRVFRLVDETRRAWHAGKGSWRGQSDINSRSIGVEIVNPGHDWGYRPFPDRQIAAVIALCRDVLSRHAIPPRNVIAHSDIAPDRKRDPGELFPWQALFDAGIGLWVPPEPAGPAEPVFGPGQTPGLVPYQRKLARYGYSTEPNGLGDDAFATVIRAFQRHFRPERIDGIFDMSTCRTLDRLLDALPRGERFPAT